MHDTICNRAFFLVTQAQSCLTLETPWTVACQAPPSMGFSRQEYWSGLPFPSPGDLPDTGIKPESPVDSLPLPHLGSTLLLLSHFSHVWLCATPKTKPTRLRRLWDSPGKNTGVGCHFLLQCMKVKSESEVIQLCLTVSDLMDCSLPGSSVHGIFQARVLEWGAIAFSLMYSAYKLNKQGDNIQPWRTPFPIWNQSVVPRQVLTVASWPAYRFSRGRSGGLVCPSLSEFSTVYCDPHSQRLWHSQ